MTASTDNISKMMCATYLDKFPKNAARYLEKISKENAITLLLTQSTTSLKKLLSYMTQVNRQSIFSLLPLKNALALLIEMDVSPSATLLMRLSEEEKSTYLNALPESYAKEIKDYMSFPEDVAGSLMEKVSHTYDQSITVGEAIQRIKANKVTPSLYLYLVDEAFKLSGRVNIQLLLSADDSQTLSSLSTKMPPCVSFLTPKDEIIETFEKSKVDTLPVLDTHNHLVGILYSSTLMQVFKEEITSDIQKMVGVSAEEKALSPSSFAIKKRLPWLFINLLTAFLAASVVGAFEGIIAKHVALAVLLPIVAGQSGNAGAQALAVTMRGLAIREISLRHWMRVVFKEMSVGAVSGFVIAIACGLAVYFWSSSVGLAVVLCISMVFSVAIACICGALIPISLKRIGQDPAQSSSIILTTFTDVAGFWSFLGIATLLSRFI
jgi:magnesium transporter